MLKELVLLAVASSISHPGPEVVVRKMFEAFNRHDASAMERLYAPEAHLSSSDFCKPRGRTDIQRTYGALFKAYPDIRDEIEALVAQGDTVAVRFTAFSHAGNLKLTIQTFLRIRDGLIVSDDSVFDAAGRPCDP
jgi:predicted SnoaL-like aldol condensation-catalyzing enzyme